MYKYKNEISWCRLGEEVYIINELNGKICIIKGMRAKVFLDISDEERVWEEEEKILLDDLVEKGVIVKRIRANHY